MGFDQAAVNALVSAAVSHAMTTGAFRSVNSHEPKSAPGSGLRAAVWAQDIRPTTSSGLAATSGIVTLNLRIYGNMLTKPEDDIDPRIMAAVSALMDQYTGDFTFGGTIRHIDLLGAYGTPLSAVAGYLEIASTVYRIMTLTVPCVINDLWVQGGIPSAEETPGRSLQVDSLGVTGGANIGGALTVGGNATVDGTLTVDEAATVGSLTVEGATASGGLTISDVPSPSGTLPFGYGNSEALTGLQIVSSYPSDDVSGGTDGTGRITLYSYQRANAYSFGETIRNFLMRWDAKAMTAWYGPTAGTSGAFTAAYDGSGNATGTNFKPWTWVGSHYEANDHASIHGHWEVEVPDSTGALQGRLAILFANTTTGAIGLDKTIINTNAGDFHVYCHGTDHTGTYQQQFLRLTGALQKAIEWNNDNAGGSAGRRWKLASNEVAESGGNAGSDFYLYRYDDTGTLVDNPIEVIRATGKVQIGGNNGTSNGLTVNSASGVGLTVNVTNTGGQAYLAVGPDATARAMQGEVSGDTTVRHVAFVDGKHEWGDGTNARDTNLYRSAANVLRTDDSLEVALNLGVGTGPNATTQRLTVLSGSSAGQMAQFKRTTASDSTPVVTVETADASSAQSLGFTVTGDTSSRCGIDANGKITWGSGSASRDTNLYRSAIGKLTTDTIFTASSVGVFTTSPREQLDVASSSAQQNRLRLESFFETDSLGTAEVARLHFGKATGTGVAGGSSSKAAIAWFDDTISTTQSQVWVQAHNYLHQYDPQTFAASGVNTSTGVITYTKVGIAPPGAWQVQFSSTGTLPTGLLAATNYYVKILSSSTFSVYNDSALTSQVTFSDQGTGTHTMTPDLTYKNNHHQHFSVEVSNSDLQNKNTRLSIPWGFDTTEIGFFQCNTTQHDGKFRIVGAAGTFRQMVLGNTLSDNLVPDGTENRWLVQADSTAESGSNVGSDFRITRANDSGTALDAPLFIKRSNGNIGIHTTSPGTTVDIGDGTASFETRVNRGSNASFIATLAVATSGTDRWGLQLRSDSTDDLHVRNLAQGLTAILAENRGTAPNLQLLSSAKSFGGGVGVLGVTDASTTPTTNPTGGIVLYSDSGSLKYRSSSGTTYFLNAKESTGRISTTTDGTVSAGVFGTTADGTANLGVVIVNPSSTAKRAIDIRLAGDAVSRLRVDMSASTSSGTLTFGDGTTADTNLYRSAATTLKTDNSLVVGATLQHAGSSLGFYNTTAVAKPTVTGSKGGNAALTSLMTALASLGLVTDSTS